MKKRMNLTEKELAIGMWLYIKLCITYTYKSTIPMIIEESYLDEHDMRGKWRYSYILCSKHDHVCSRCPLGSCSDNYKTFWSIVINSVYDNNVGAYMFSFTLEERLEACDKIIEAIEKDVPDDYKS